MFFCYCAISSLVLTISTIDATAPLNFYVPLVFCYAIFLFLAASIQHGDRKTDAAQRLSLFIPILAAWLLFNEEFNSLK
jgi:hypothetical protein